VDYHRQAHAVYYTRYHLVFGTKYRRKILRAGMGAWLALKIREVSRFHPEVQILAVKTDLDHVHVLVSIAPKTSVSTAVNLIKSNTGRAMRRRFPYLDRVYYGGDDGVWATGYFCSTVGVNESTVQRYIELQGREDSGQAQLVL
jgi:putative transposase